MNKKGVTYTFVAIVGAVIVVSAIALIYLNAGERLPGGFTDEMAKISFKFRETLRLPGRVASNLITNQVPFFAPKYHDDNRDVAVIKPEEIECSNFIDYEISDCWAVAEERWKLNMLTNIEMNLIYTQYLNDQNGLAVDESIVNTYCEYKTFCEENNQPGDVYYDRVKQRYIYSEIARLLERCLYISDDYSFRARCHRFSVENLSEFNSGEIYETAMFTASFYDLETSSYEFVGMDAAENRINFVEDDDFVSGLYLKNVAEPVYAFMWDGEEDEEKDKIKLWHCSSKDLTNAGYCEGDSYDISE